MIPLGGGGGGWAKGTWGLSVLTVTRAYEFQRVELKTKIIPLSNCNPQLSSKQDRRSKCAKREWKGEVSG